MHIALLLLLLFYTDYTEYRHVNTQYIVNQLNQHLPTTD